MQSISTRWQIHIGMSVPETAEDFKSGKSDVFRKLPSSADDRGEFLDFTYVLW